MTQLVTWCARNLIAVKAFELHLQSCIRQPCTQARSCREALGGFHTWYSVTVLPWQHLYCNDDRTLIVCVRWGTI